MTKINPECMECENDALAKYSELYIEHDRLKTYASLLEQSLVANEKLLKFFRVENQELKNKLEVYKDDRD